MSQMNNQLKIAVCDDHEADRRVLIDFIAEYLDQQHQIAQIDAYTSSEELLASDVGSYQLLFMDIIMSGMNGMEAAKKLFRENTRTKIVFCSSSVEYGVESYDVDALHYLMKPVKKDGVFTVLDRFFQVYMKLRTITVTVDRVEEHIYLKDILWVEADRNRCIIHTIYRDYITRMSFSSLCGQLPPEDFVKPIRYALVSLRAAATMPSDVIILENGTEIPISKDNRAAVKRAYMDYQWNSMYE